MNKFDKLESDSNQKMKDYEKKIYDLEKNHIREQDRLKVGKIHLLMTGGCRTQIPIVVGLRTAIS